MFVSSFASGKSIWLMNTKRDTRPAIDYSLIAPEPVASNLTSAHFEL